jgi:serine acetyltransferase
VERAATGFRHLRPQFCSIHDIAFWRHERYWKLVARPDLFNGTPFKNLMWRLLGVRIGRQVFDDGCGMPERTLVEIGDHCTLNAGSTIQCHSQEDGGFKSDRITLGAEVTVGVGAWVHYGVSMGDRSSLAPDSFLMKGEEVPPGAHWAGNPAQEMTEGWVHPQPLHVLDTGKDSAEDAGLDSGPTAVDAPHDFTVAVRNTARNEADDVTSLIELLGPADLDPPEHGRHRAGRRRPAGISAVAFVNGKHP